jgi:hypothetical protein
MAIITNILMFFFVASLTLLGNGCMNVKTDLFNNGDFTKARQYQRLDDYPNALKHYTKSIQKKYSISMSFNNRGNVFVAIAMRAMRSQNKKLVEESLKLSINDFNVVINRKDNKSALIHSLTNRALSNFYLMKFRIALSDCNEAISLGFAPAIGIRAFIKVGQKQFESALKDYQRFKKLNVPISRFFISPEQAKFVKNEINILQGIAEAGIENDQAKFLASTKGTLYEEWFIQDISKFNKENKSQKLNSKISYLEEPDTIPPKIIIRINDNIDNKSKKLITGQASDKSGVAIVEVNGKEAYIDDKGNFSSSVLLKPGKNNINITAIDVFENKSYEAITIERLVEKNEVKPIFDKIKAGKYYAVIIAVNDYEHSDVEDLNQPIKDALKIKNVLRKYSFYHDDIYFLKNPNREKIIDTFDMLSQKISYNDNLLIFYAGHGYWDEKFKQGYWLPSDSASNRKTKWLSNSTIRDYIRGIQTRHTLLISDACFSGGILKTRRAFQNAPTSINELNKLPSRKAITSGTLTIVPDKSIFTKYLVKRLQENTQRYISSEQLFVQFKQAVINNSPTKQIPQFGEIREAGDEGGDFIFVLRND